MPKQMLPRPAQDSQCLSTRSLARVAGGPRCSPKPAGRPPRPLTAARRSGQTMTPDSQGPRAMVQQLRVHAKAGAPLASQSATHQKARGSESPSL
eukprot:12274626-Heterocapsa_arctica.AAC.1